MVVGLWEAGFCSLSAIFVSCGDPRPGELPYVNPGLNLQMGSYNCALESFKY